MNAKALAVYIGHSSVTITLDRYGHLMPGNEPEAAARLDAFLEAMAQKLAHRAAKAPPLSEGRIPLTRAGIRRRVALTPTRRLEMLARVVTFDGVTKERMDEMRSEIEGGEPPEGLNPKEMIALHDPESDKVLVMILFENEDDYRRGDEVLSAMPAGDTPGQRTAVTRYDVAIHQTM